MSENDIFYMSEALKEAEKALDCGDVPIGAIIVRSGEIISRAYNTREKVNNATGHAELDAIRKASETLGRWRLSDCTLYVTMEPCPMCAGAIINSRIPNVICAVKDAKAGAFGSVIDMNSYPLNHKVDVRYGVMERESRELLRKFFEMLRNRG